jgi:DnaJ family protein C protein 17
MPSTSAELEDYWKVLGLEPGASKSEVAKAYRRKSLQVHPDRYKGDDPEWATEEFLRLTRAKDVLEDDKARAAFENVQRARAMNKQKQQAQDAVRRKFREDLEAREEAASKRQRTSEASTAARMQQ